MMDTWNEIPTWDNGTWTVTNFDSREEFRTFVLTIFSEPGKYKFNEDTNSIFNEFVFFIKIYLSLLSQNYNNSCCLFSP